MCLVSYTPTKDGFILGSNRDESPMRSATKIITEDIGAHRVTFPRDTQGGSWIMWSDHQWLVCLLNGAFTIHERQIPYRMSRGIMLKELFKYKKASAFMQNVELDNIEPFTTIIFDIDELYEFRWDGEIKHIKILDQGRQHIWSSCTLYTPENQLLRESKFRTLSAGIVPSKDRIREIHLQGVIGDPENDFMMNRENRVRTISNTIISYSEEKLDHDFINLVD